MTNSHDEQMLDAVFADMRVDVDPSDDLLNRIMMDADGILASSASGAVSAAARPKLSFGAMILDLVGGWPSMGGLAVATVAGLWIGVVQPTALTDLSGGIWGGTLEVPLLESDVFAGLGG